MKKFSSVCLYMFIFSISLSMMSENHVYAQSTTSDKYEYVYPANKEKNFDETVDEFYQALRELKYSVHKEFYQRYKQKPKEQQRHLDTNIFKEMPDASLNIRKKLLFKEVEQLNYIILDGNFLRPYPDIDINYHQAISPDRLVFFFFSFKDTDDEFRGRYAIYDVETKEMIAGGNTYMPKQLLTRKNEKEK